MQLYISDRFCDITRGEEKPSCLSVSPHHHLQTIYPTRDSTFSEVVSTTWFSRLSWIRHLSALSLTDQRAENKQPFHSESRANLQCKHAIHVPRSLNGPWEPRATSGRYARVTGVEVRRAAGWSLKTKWECRDPGGWKYSPMLEYP